MRKERLKRLENWLRYMQQKVGEWTLEPSCEKAVLGPEGLCRGLEEGDILVSVTYYALGMWESWGPSSNPCAHLLPNLPAHWLASPTQSRAAEAIWTF